MLNQPLNPDFYLKIHHRCVQDLAWCLFSQPLIDDSREHACHSLSPFGSAAAQIQALDEDPSELIRWLDSGTSTRLGLVFERFWQFWWRTRESTENSQWRFNEQINKNGRTLGELDALQWHPSTGQLTHYELAVKFYLQVPASALAVENTHPQAKHGYWVGPNLKDRLDIKWPQMRDRQLTALEDPYRRPALPWKPDHIETRSLTRGRLFTPRFVFPKLREEPLDTALNPQHGTGHWLHLDDWHRVEDGYWKLLQRRDWFAPLHGERDQLGILTNAQALQALTEHFKQFRQPIQIIKIDTNKTGWSESERLFVVPTAWPNNHKKS